VHPTVPGHVDEPDETIGLKGADPAEAVSLDLAAPVDVEDGMGESLCVECVDGGVGYGCTPLEAKRRPKGCQQA
jgi:hypothetical protein